MQSRSRARSHDTVSSRRTDSDRGRFRYLLSMIPVVVFCDAQAIALPFFY